jgi:hypothetical protein
MPSTDGKLELKAKTSMAQTASQAAVYAKVLTAEYSQTTAHCNGNFGTDSQMYGL